MKILAAKIIGDNLEKMLKRTDKESLGLVAGLADGWREAQVESPQISVFDARFCSFWFCF